MTHIRKALIGLLLTAALAAAIPAAALADSSSSDTTESLTVASTVSMTAQASATYALGDESGDNGPDFAAHIVLTVLSSNNPSGITVSAKVDPFVTGGGINVATSRRITLLDQIDCSASNQSIPPYVCPASPVPVAASGAALTKAFTLAPVGTFATSSTAVTVATATGPLANADLGTTFIVDADDFPVGGTYTSAVHWTTTTNP